jgi:hypothetical protein
MSPVVAFLALMILLASILASRSRVPLAMPPVLLACTLLVVGLAMWLLSRRSSDRSGARQLLSIHVLFLAAGLGMGSELLFRSILMRFSNLLALAISVACIALLRETSNNVLFVVWMLAFFMALNIVLIKAFSMVHVI